MGSMDKMGFPRGMLLMGFSTMIIPLMDIPRVMVARIRAGRDPFTPDKNHIHHKLLRTGMKPFLTMITLLAVAIFLIAFTVIGVMLGLDKTLILIIDILLGIILHLIIDHFIAVKENDNRS
jgi:UDP-N-acetylmuramyl pentapeptide phosphotransferase/UDP-N-acetylglucosamine-1-phosphate transferase